ncbi:hypothetical protein CHS0354_014111 [Potamilus streckersoni]|uniref:Uncharacterized protein n=1 Tax=Potamilus streckersoni TaxID=2493646 RepID=A0AAE0WG80_9BIVA|nr:hypothetical protein CHS0354_014111 [Potamilus streckersoni]
MKILQYRPILVLLCIYVIVVLYFQVRYTYVTGMISECDAIFKKRKELLPKEQLDKMIIGRPRPPGMPRRNSDLNSDISLNNDVDHGLKNRPIITLCTYFETDYTIALEKVLVFNNTLYNWQTFIPLVYNNTLYNWQSFIPHVQLILFTKKNSSGKKVKFMNWNIFPILYYSDSGAPTIKAMFKQVKELYDTYWYGYFNGDILLTEDILETLEYVSRVSDHFPNASIFIIGRRINVLNVTSEEVRKINGVKESARSRGSLHDIYTEDYFITNRFFSWDKIPEFVIGHAGYDNWIVGHARCDLGTIVIDATETLTAVHQDTRKDKNKEVLASTAARYNFELMQRLPRRFLQGLTTCAEWKTFRTLKTGRIELIRVNSSTTIIS